jgi:Asp-tRNA(Asn)/Glu-tRNA(Gln) amidotransferase A subunit family amidase
MLITKDNFDATIAKIKREDEGIHAFVDFASSAEVNPSIGENLGAKVPGNPLQYWSLAVKSNIAVRGLPHTAGIGAYRNRIASDDAFCVARLREAGAQVIGTANMEEAALGAVTDNPHFGKTHNPRRHGFTAGGSSGGSAAAVAAGFARFALGTDTMGSCRIPAAYCGVVGFKPSYGAISTRGVEPLSRRMDHVGLIANSVADVAAAFSIAGVYDAACADARAFARTEDQTPSCVKFTVLDEASLARLQPQVRIAYEHALAKLRGAGHRLTARTIDQASLATMRRAGLLICEAELANSLAPLLVRNDAGVSPFLKKMIAFGAAKSAPQLAEAYAKIADAVLLERELLHDVDAILWPTAPQVAFAFGETVPADQADFTCVANFTGSPAISLPVPVAADELPVGLQLIMPYGEDSALLKIASHIEAALA